MPPVTRMASMSEPHRPPSNDNSDSKNGTWRASDTHLIVTDGLMLKCTIKNTTFVPEEIVEQEKVLKMLKQELEEFSLDPSIVSPDVFDETDAFRANPSHFGTNSRMSDTSSENELSGELPPMRESHPHPHPRLRRRKASSTEKLTLMLRKATVKEPTVAQSILLKISPTGSLCPQIEEEDDPLDCMWKEKLRLKFEDQFNWINKGEDESYVGVEKLHCVQEFEVLLGVIQSSRQPIALQVRLNRDNTLTALYHPIKQFRQDFMMLKVNGDYCLFMEPF